MRTTEPMTEESTEWKVKWEVKPPGQAWRPIDLALPAWFVRRADGHAQLWQCRRHGGPAMLAPSRATAEALIPRRCVVWRGPSATYAWPIQ